MNETHTCSKADCLVKAPQPLSEFNRGSNGWTDSNGVGRHLWCKTCSNKRVAPSNKRVNPKNNAISRVMHERMVGLDIPHEEHYADEHAELRKRLRKEINMDGSWQKKCTDCDEPLIPGKNWTEARQRGNIHLHTVCDSKRTHISNALRARAAERNGLGRGLGAGSKWGAQSKKWKKEQLAIQRKIDADNGISEGQTEPADKPEKPKKIKEKISAGRWVEVKAGRRWCNNSTLSDQRNNLEIRKGVCELSGLEIRFCDTSHLVAQMVCEALGHKEWIEDEGNVVLLDMRFNRAMEFGWAFDETGRFCPPPGEEYPEWMVKLGIPDKRIEVTEARLKFIIRAGAFGG